MTSGLSTDSRPRVWTALLGLALGLGGIAAVATSGIGYRLGWWPVRTALGISEYAAYAAILGLGLSLVGLVGSLRLGARRDVLWGLLGLAASLPVVAMAAHWEYTARAYPPINDISTDTEDPPVFWDVPNPSAYPGGETAALQRAAYPDLAPLALGVAPERAFALALALAEDSDWEIVAEEPEEGRIEAVDSTLLYGFKDEIVIRVEPSEDGAVVDLRSRSRLGRSDLGVNAARISRFLAALEERAAAEN
ncbi:MAG: DUF1499 domain-containing protein [Kiloniellaceae bacterium]|nr:DUF1499 domain-containing protein [Kiloniellaceae bacterium]